MRKPPAVLLAALMLAAPSPAQAVPEPVAIASPGPEAGWQEPRDLADAVRRLAAAREALARTNQVKLRYTEAQLRDFVARGVVPNARYMVRLVYGEARVDAPMGFPREGGRLPLWVTTFDQLEPADSDPEAITRVLGIPYDATQAFTLLVIKDLGADEARRPALICPTLAALGNLASQDLATPYVTSADLADAMAPGYQAPYRDLMAAFYQRGFKEYLQDDVERFIADEARLREPAAAKRFRARLRVHVQYGASDLFRGDGITQLTGSAGRQVGVMELFVLDPAPKPIGSYEGRGQLVRIRCAPLPRTAPIAFKDPT
ncbi:MAG: hypothetical protein JWM80_3337 [Cyanobacteria bacterium RYN_339]|nr:hypothetical protein [Cyanobacteria bacterium RYN_339]